MFYRERFYHGDLDGRGVCLSFCLRRNRGRGRPIFAHEESLMEVVPYGEGRRVDADGLNHVTFLDQPTCSSVEGVGALCLDIITRMTVETRA